MMDVQYVPDVAAGMLVVLKPPGWEVDTSMDQTDAYCLSTHLQALRTMQDVPVSVRYLGMCWLSGSKCKGTVRQKQEATAPPFHMVEPSKCLSKRSSSKDSPVLHLDSYGFGFIHRLDVASPSAACKWLCTARASKRRIFFAAETSKALRAS